MPRFWQRRQIAFLLLCLFSGTHEAKPDDRHSAKTEIDQAVNSKTIDRRGREEDLKYAIVFAAQAPDKSSYGHAFIIWEREDESKQMTTTDAIGFWPSGDPNTVELIFGTPGALETDANTPVDSKLVVLVDSDRYQLALNRKSEWQQNGRYKAFWQNCVSHVADVAKSIGLETSTGSWVKPQDYVHDLSGKNESLPVGSKSGTSQDSPVFPHETGSPTLPGDGTGLQKLEYGLQLAKWIRVNHPLTSFKQQAAAGKLDPFEWQMIEALSAINSVPDARLLGGDPTQTQYWGHVFFEEIVERADYETALKHLQGASSKPSKIQNELIGGAKEMVRAAVAQQLASYLDRGASWQTLTQLAERLRNSSDPLYSGVASNLANTKAAVNQAAERAAVERSAAEDFQECNLVRQRLSAIRARV